MPTRDYAAEMATYIETRTPEGDYVTSKVAKQIAEQVRRDDADLLTGWLMLNATSLIAKQISHSRLVTRARSRKSLKQSRFADAANAFESGNPEPLQEYLDKLRYTTPGNVSKPLGNLTGADCRFIASTFHDTSSTMHFEAVFMDALARKVPSGTVRDHLTDAQVSELRANVADAIQRRSAAISA